MPTTERETRLAAYIGELKTVLTHINQDRDLTADDKADCLAIEDVIGDLSGNLVKATTARLEDEAPRSTRTSHNYMTVGGAS